jgi:hypothetical protein
VTQVVAPRPGVWAFPPLLAVAVAWMGLALGFVWGGYRSVYEVQLSGDWLTCLALFRTREVPLAEIRALRRTRFPRGSPSSN